MLPLFSRIRPEDRPGKPARRRKPAAPTFDTLEQRATPGEVASMAALPGVGSLLQTLRREVSGRAITTDPAGVAAIVSALRGGPGSDFVALLRRQVPNLRRIIGQFVAGTRTEFTTRGFAVKTPKLLDSYTGFVADQLNPTAAGALLQKNKTLQLAAILRGPIDIPTPSYYVFGIDRGAGGAAGPFPGLPGIRYDALVTVAWHADGPGVTASVTDLVSNTTTPIDGARIKVQGATLRVYVPTDLLPSQGLATRNYRFAFWTRDALDGGIEQIGSFVPGTASIPIGVAPGVRR